MYFEELCLRLKNGVFYHHTLLLHHACFTINFLAVILLFTEFLLNLETLVFSKQPFANYYSERQYNGHSRIEVLGMFQCENLVITHFHMLFEKKKKCYGNVYSMVQKFVFLK